MVHESKLCKFMQDEFKPTFPMLSLNSFETHLLLLVGGGGQIGAPGRYPDRDAGRKMAAWTRSQKGRNINEIKSNGRINVLQAMLC